MFEIKLSFGQGDSGLFLNQSLGTVFGQLCGPLLIAPVVNLSLFSVSWESQR